MAFIKNLPQTVYINSYYWLLKKICFVMPCIILCSAPILCPSDNNESLQDSGSLSTEQEYAQSKQNWPNIVSCDPENISWIEWTETSRFKSKYKACKVNASSSKMRTVHTVDDHMFISFEKDGKGSAIRLWVKNENIYKNPHTIITSMPFVTYVKGQYRYACPTTVYISHNNAYIKLETTNHKKTELILELIPSEQQALNHSLSLFINQEHPALPQEIDISATVHNK